MNVKRVLLVTLLIAGFLAVYYRTLYFGPPIFETGDYAANALQITNAKTFNELYGNFSRWGFNHPGPAFFYCYALGEILFYNVLPVFHSPHQAHAFMGLLLQSFFLALALVTCSYFSRSWLFAGFLVLFAVVHFLFASFAFVDIWPPNVLAGPMIALITCATAVSCGNSSYLPFLVLSSCFLIHGHVAQPLFVAPITAISISMYFVQRRSDQERSSDRTAWMASGVIFLLFALPIIIDFFKGDESNIGEIIRHLETHTGESKSLAQSIGYLLSFMLFKYKAGTDIVITSDFNLVEFIRDNQAFLSIWAVVILLPSFLLYKRKPPTDLLGADKQYFQRLAVFCVLAILLTIQWGRIQDGDLLAFNAHFNYALILLAAIPFTLLLSEAIEVATPSFVRPVLTCAGIIVLYLAIITHPSPTDSQLESNPLLPKYVHSLLETSGRKPTVLLFEESAGPKALGVALALQREGVPFLVTRNWGFMFGYRNVLDLRTKTNTVNTWRVATSSNNSVDITQLVLK